MLGMKLIDTHCHLHDNDFFSPEQAELILNASADQLEMMVLIGTSVEDSRQAVKFSEQHKDKTRVAVGVHPHEAAKIKKQDMSKVSKNLATLAENTQVVAVGECGLDFFYNDRSALLRKQIQLLELQLQLAIDRDLAVSFHVREAFEDFWPVLANFTGIRGVLHSFTDSSANALKALHNNLYIGVNGIATFTKHTKQLEMFANLPLSNIVLETDAPFLTPSPIRGTINEPKNVIYITNFLAELRGEDAEQIVQSSTENARRLFRG